MDDMRQFEAAARQSLLPPAPDAGAASPCFLGVSLFTAAAACLFFLAALSAIYYCCYIAIVSSDKESLLLKLKGRNSGKKKKKNQNNDNDAPPAPPGRGSSWWWSVAETLAFVAANSSGRGFYHFVHARHRRYGPPCFRTALFGRTHVFVSSPDAARSLLAAEPAGFSKRYVRTVADLLGEHSLLCASHAAHRSLRRAVAPLFNARATASFAATFDALTRRLMRDWSTSSSGAAATVVVLDAALEITFEAICDMLVATLPRDARRQLQGDVLAVTRAMLAFPLRLPGTRFHAGIQARRRIMEVLRREIASRRRDGSLRQQRGHNHSSDDMDFLQSLLLRSQQQSDNDEAPLTDEQILDNILTLIIAGQVTTAAAVTWMVKYLADNRDFQQTLRSVQLELAPKHQDSPLTLQHLSSMELAYKAVKESLRMASIVSWFPRVALDDCQVAGFHISKGWIVNVDARSLHYDPTIYENPTTFDPSRFNGGDMKQPYSFLVFGAGGRTCLGMNLAKIMMLIFLHRLVTTFRWEMADEDTSLEKWAMFPRLKNGCPIHLTPI
ncbi:Abscisic acid 8'-hydroxylase 4 [Dichanthelium oligosanthes]|uniref:Abscisic acid 8'-hydroxylase 4 n=1 Tax=Dichanthelium oligosanthes TaxID=888268 RepID=A0A1E5V3W6_9POAL|nr:Abscisic acid 8'-hydroxylase 4 [Dichanthelium oligosanthes]